MNSTSSIHAAMNPSTAELDSAVHQGTSPIEPTACHSPESRPRSPPKDSETLPSVKRKRDKYTGKACGPCKRRKIKCGGGSPCPACVRRKRTCSVLEPDTSSRSKHGDIERGEAIERESESVKTLQSRMATLEAHLETLNQALSQLVQSEAQSLTSGQSPWGDGSHDSNHGVSASSATNYRQPSSYVSGTSPKDGLRFTTSEASASKKHAGETSVVHAIRRVEDHLSELGLPVPEDRGPAPGTPPMTPSASVSMECIGTRPDRHIPALLRRHTIMPDRAEWDMSLQTFLVEVHPLYPFLSEEVVRQIYCQLWVSVVPGPGVSSEIADTDRSVQALLILANGRCATSSRIQSDKSSSSAGWSLYCAAMELQGSLLEIVRDDCNAISRLHTLTLVVIYLLRLDATERAQKILSLAIIHAHHLGIHLIHVHEDMPEAHSNEFKRVWWCLYVLDRRIALVLGRPFVIHDSNVTVGLIDDTDLSSDSEVTTWNDTSDDVDLFRTRGTPILYLNVMVGYSKVVGKVWEVLFGADSGDCINTHIHEYLDSLVHTWMASVPPVLVCDPDDVHRSAIPLSAALFKQRFLIRLRYISILNVIRSPNRRTHTIKTIRASQTIEADSICLRQARCIVEMFSQCSLSDGVYGFPFLPYLLDATILILACLTRMPNLKSSYRDTVDNALGMLKNFYRKTWVSGKVARIVFKLDSIIPRIFSLSVATQAPGSGTDINLQETETYTTDRSNIHGSIDERQKNTVVASTVLSTPEAWMRRSQYQDAWNTEHTESMGVTFDNEYRANSSRPQEFTDKEFASLDFGFEDFPFEINLGSALQQTSNLPACHARSDAASYNYPAADNSNGNSVDWLQDLIALDSRLFTLG